MDEHEIYHMKREIWKLKMEIGRYEIFWQHAYEHLDQLENILLDIEENRLNNFVYGGK